MREPQAAPVSQGTSELTAEPQAAPVSQGTSGMTTVVAAVEASSAQLLGSISASSGGRHLSSPGKDQHLSSPPPLPLPPPPPQPTSSQNHRASESAGSESRKPTRSVSSSSEKADRLYMMKGSAAVATVFYENNGNRVRDEKRVVALPRLFPSLSNKEEEDFMAMKGCKMPQRPNKRVKFIQKSILLVNPGAWLTDLSHERSAQKRGGGD